MTKKHFIALRSAHAVSVLNHAWLHLSTDSKDPRELEREFIVLYKALQRVKVDQEVPHLKGSL